jgi:hypothetical protein
MVAIYNVCETKKYNIESVWQYCIFISTALGLLVRVLALRRMNIERGSDYESNREATSGDKGVVFAYGQHNHADTETAVIKGS